MNIDWVESAFSTTLDLTVVKTPLIFSVYSILLLDTVRVDITEIVTY